MKRPLKAFVLLTCLLTLATSALRATPYASGITNNAGTVSFILNESADNVTVEFDGGASSTNLGSLAKGTHTFFTSGGTFHIVVRKSSGPGYLSGVTNYISDDDNALLRFVNQRGVAVNRNPASPLFGRIYVSVSQSGVNSASSRSLEDGIYVLNADQTDALGQSNTALTGGINWTNPPPNAESPHRLFVGPDDSLFINDWSDSNGSAYMTDGNVANGVNLLGGPVGSVFPIGAGGLHGSISAIYAEGSLAGGDLKLWVIDEDLTTDRNSVWLWDIGAGPVPFDGPPTKVASPLITTASQLADLARGPDGKWYISQRRAEPATTAGVYVRSADGATALWNSRQASRDFLNDPVANDLLGETCAVDVSPDGKYLAVLRRDTNLISVLPLIDGIPDMANRIIMPTLSAVGVARDMGFDAAGNLYYVSSGQGLLRILSPGGATVARTGSDRTFNVSVVQLPGVTVTAGPSANELGGPPGSFTLMRSGDTSAELTVNFELTGTATNGADYTSVPLSATFATGSSTATIEITAIDDVLPEFPETVVLTLSAGTNYVPVAPASAMINIFDNEYPNLLTVTAVDTNTFERFPTDTFTFRLTRQGDTNTEAFVNITLDGTATEGNDYSPRPGSIFIAPGVITMDLTFSPLDDSDVDPDETVILALADGADYTIGTPGSATVRIRDDELAPAPVLFADNFENDTSASWITRFGANDGLYDATTTFAYDYVANGIPLAPHSVAGTTKGLWVGVNKAHTNSAGINFYPAGQSFSGDFALRFDMFLSFGAINTTEHAIAGLNHSTLLTNRVTQSTDTNNTTRGGDGVWVAIETDGSDNRDYTAYTVTNQANPPVIIASRTASAMAGLVTSPPYAFAGSPGIGPTNAPKEWSQVELRQVANVVTLTVNAATVFTFTNTSGYTSGDVMLGINDQFNSISSAAHFVIFDNVEVISLGSAGTNVINITGISFPSANQVAIDFTSSGGGVAADFHLQSRASLSPTDDWTDDAGATITTTANGFRATTTRAGNERYYRVRR